MIVVCEPGQKTKNFPGHDNKDNICLVPSLGHKENFDLHISYHRKEKFSPHQQILGSHRMI